MNRFTLDPAFRALLVDLGLDVAHVLRRAGQPADLLSRGAVRLPEDEYFAVWTAIEESTDDPSLPLRMAELISPEVFDPPIFAALCSADLNEAALRVAKYKRIIGPVRIDIDTSPTALQVTMVWPTTEVPGLLVTADLLFWVAVVRIATRHRIEPLAFSVPTPPANVGPYSEYLGVEILAAPLPRVTFSAFDAARPFLTANRQMWSAFEPDLRKCLAQLDAGASTAERVRSALLELIPGGEASMDSVARALAVSTRTLHRWLKEEGTTFKRVLNATRESLAMHYLADPARSIGEISFLLGFEEPSSFYRAFRSWTGETPDRARRSLA